MSRLILILLILLFLLILLCPSSARAIDISLVGDSHMEGVSPYLRSYLSDSGHTVHVVAHRGWSCLSYRRADSYLRREVGHSDLVVLLLGSNDRRIDRDQYSADLEWVLHQTGDARVVWIGPPASSDVLLDSRHLAITRLQSQLLLHIPWFDSRPDTEHLHHSSGGVHFTRRSYQIWANRILDHISTYL